MVRDTGILQQRAVAYATAKGITKGYSHAKNIRLLKLFTIVTVVPLHKEVDIGTLLEILRQAKLNREEFLKLIK